MGRFGKRVFENHAQHRYWYDDEGALRESCEEEILDVESDLGIDPNNLDGEMQDHAKILGWYMQLEEEVTEATKHARAAWYRAVEDQADKIRRKEEKKKIPSSKCVSETTLKRRVNCSSEVRAAIQKYMRLSSKSRAISGYIRALTERGRMLQSMNKKQTNEFNQTK